MSYNILQKVYYTPLEISKILSVSPPTIRKLIASQLLRGVRIRRKILVSRDDLKSYLETLRMDIEKIRLED
jgi:excisionase family DNA binding protein